jgi:hypothetical protein
MAEVEDDDDEHGGVGVGKETCLFNQLVFGDGNVLLPMAGDGVNP